MKSFPIVLASMVALSGGTHCNSPNEVVVPAIPDAAIIQGKIIAWSFADTMSIQATATLVPAYTSDVFASTKVNADGTFLLVLPEPPIAAQLPWGYRKDFVSDTAARFVVVWFLEIAGPSRSERHWAYNANMSSSGQDLAEYFDTFPAFARGSASATGTDTLILRQTLDSPLDTLLMVRDLRFAGGWNRIVRRQAQVRTHVTVETWRCEDTRTPNWHLQHPGQLNINLQLTE